MVHLKHYIVSLGLIAKILGDAAPVATDSVGKPNYIATFKTPNFANSSSITGTFEFEADKDGKVHVYIDINNLPTTGGPFMYHIHQKPVPANGNCTGTLAHLNPYGGLANATTIATHEVGDLSGKHGTINGTSFKSNYVDEYLSLNPENRAYIGNVSVVIHAANNARLACANITVDSAHSGSNSSNSTSSAIRTSSESTGAAAITGFSSALLAVVIGLLL